MRKATAPARLRPTDVDRVADREPLAAALRRRLDGGYSVDRFGADPQLVDALAPLVGAVVRVEVEHAERLPRVGPALLVANRTFGLAEPAVVALGVRQAARRRVRVVGARELPFLSGVLRKLGAVGPHPDDVAAVLRAGHLAAAPLAPTWLLPGAGEPPRALLAAVLGFPVVPVAVVPGGPARLPFRPWRMIVGRVVETATDAAPGDALTAAELAERVRDAVRGLLSLSGAVAASSAVTDG